MISRRMNGLGPGPTLSAECGNPVSCRLTWPVAPDWHSDDRVPGHHSVKDQVDRLLAVKELDDYLVVPLATIYSWRYHGVGPPGFRVGRRVRFRWAVIERWVQAQLAAQAYQNWWRALEQDPDSRGVRVDAVDPEACRLDAVGIRFVSFDVF